MNTKIIKPTPDAAPAVKVVVEKIASAAKKTVLKKMPPSTKTKPITVKPRLTKPILAKPAAPKAVVAKPMTKVVVTAVKAKKQKLVRDSFTMPKDEYVVIDSLKLRAGKLGQSPKKSELLRAGIKALAALSDIQFKAALSNVPAIKTGRPKDIK